MNYKVTNKILYREIICIQASGILTNEIWEMFLHMAHKIERKFNNRPEDQLDIIHHSVEIAINNINRFNSDKSENAFAYFTEVIKTGMTFAFRKLYLCNNGEYRFSQEIPLFSADPKDFE